MLDPSGVLDSICVLDSMPACYWPASSPRFRSCSAPPPLATRPTPKTVFPYPRVTTPLPAAPGPAQPLGPSTWLRGLAAAARSRAAVGDVVAGALESGVRRLVAGFAAVLTPLVGRCGVPATPSPASAVEDASGPQRRRGSQRGHAASVLRHVCTYQHSASIDSCGDSASRSHSVGRD